jgi:hypothetical protein
MLGLGSSIVYSSRSHSEIITLYDQESFTDVGDWYLEVSIGTAGNSALTAGETAPGSSNNDWLKAYYDQDHVVNVFLAYPILGITQSDLGIIEGDQIGFSADIYLDGPWGLSGGERDFAFINSVSFQTWSMPIVPTDQELSVVLQSPESIRQQLAASAAGASAFPALVFAPSINGVIKAGCSMYLRNIKITAERY